MIEPSTTQFWWNWWVSLAVAAGTIGAVIVAWDGQWEQGASEMRRHLVVEKST